MTALYIAIGFLGGRAIRHLLDKHPPTKPGRLNAARTKNTRRAGVGRRLLSGLNAHHYAQARK